LCLRNECKLSTKIIEKSEVFFFNSNTEGKYLKMAVRKKNNEKIYRKKNHSIILFFEM
jgi:hypothetical protein